MVFEILRDAQCSECGVEMGEGSFLLIEAEQPHCLACAGFGDLELLAAGDVALTGRATKHSARNAVVVRFSRTRKRYESQGVLVETSALENAEWECGEDAEERAAGRAREAVRRREEDRKLVARMAKQIGVLFPGCPTHELAAITEHTAARGSGRVGRTEALKGLVFVSEVFHNEEIGLEQMGGKMHRVFFSNTKLGEFNCAEMRFPSRGWAR